MSDQTRNKMTNEQKEIKALKKQLSEVRQLINELKLEAGKLKGAYLIMATK